MKTLIPVRRVMQDSIRMYFAPLTGAYKGIRAELNRADLEIQRHRAAEALPKSDLKKNHT